MQSAAVLGTIGHSRRKREGFLHVRQPLPTSLPWLANGIEGGTPANCKDYADTIHTSPLRPDMGRMRERLLHSGQKCFYH